MSRWMSWTALLALSAGSIVACSSSNAPIFGDAGTLKDSGVKKDSGSSSTSKDSGGSVVKPDSGGSGGGGGGGGGGTEVDSGGGGGGGGGGTCTPKATLQDPTCNACAGGSCCESLNGYAEAPDANGFMQCASACTDQACIDGCTAKYPAAAAAFETFSGCLSSSCATECGGGGGGGGGGSCQPKYKLQDATCNTCAQGKCCEEFNAYGDNTETAGLQTCASKCGQTDQACFEACMQQYPSATQALNSFGTCLDTNCKTECPQ